MELPIDTGDVCIVLTDGCVEWRNTGGTLQSDDLTAVVVRKTGPA